MPLDIKPSQFKSYSAWEYIEAAHDTAGHLSRVAARVTKFATAAKKITNCNLTSEATQRHLASDLSGLLLEVQNAWLQLALTTQRELFMTDAALDKETTDEFERLAAIRAQRREDIRID